MGHEGPWTTSERFLTFHSPAAGLAHFSLLLPGTLSLPSPSYTTHLIFPRGHIASLSPLLFLARRRDRLCTRSPSRARARISSYCHPQPAFTRREPRWSPSAVSSGRAWRRATTPFDISRHFARAGPARGSPGDFSGSLAPFPRSGFQIPSRHLMAQARGAFAAYKPQSLGPLAPRSALAGRATPQHSPIPHHHHYCHRAAASWPRRRTM